MVSLFLTFIETKRRPKTKPETNRPTLVDAIMRSHECKPRDFNDVSRTLDLKFICFCCLIMLLSLYCVKLCFLRFLTGSMQITGDKVGKSESGQ